MSRELNAMSLEPISGEAQLREIDERHFLAQQIFVRRESRHWSQDELAQASGLTQAQANPTLRTLAKLANAFTCRVRDLFQGSA